MRSKKAPDFSDQGHYNWHRKVRQKKMEEKNKTNIIETGVVEVKVTANWGTGESIQMNNDAEPIKNILCLATKAPDFSDQGLSNS